MKREITGLIERCIQLMVTEGYSQSTINQYKFSWECGILVYMKSQETTFYTSLLGANFIREYFSEDDNSLKFKVIRRSIRFLDNYIKFGDIRYSPLTPVEYTLYGEIGKYMQLFIDNLNSLNRSPFTIKKYKLYFYRFIVYSDSKGVHTLTEITEQHILNFISTSANAKMNIIYCLRALFQYLADNRLYVNTYSETLSGFKEYKKEKIPSYYDADEIIRIEKSINRSGRIGKRNYAIFLIASKLGLRASDIANLQFSNIDWDRNEIIIRQQKTKKQLKLPLLSDIGNAIIDYLKYGRRNSDSQQLFLSCRPPYQPANSGMICGIIRSVMEHSNVVLDGRKHGPHSLRHSLASSLLESGTPMPTISEVLGHSSTDTTMTYLRIDITSLRKCVLEVIPVEPDYYTHKKELLYE